MKRLLLLLVLFILGLNNYSQGKIFVSLDASPTYSFRTYKLIDYSSGNSNLLSGKILYDSFKKYSDSTESPKFGFKISANIGYSINDKLVLTTGFHFNKIGYKIDKTLRVAHFVVNGNIISSVYSDFKLDLYSNLYYFGIPIGIEYKICTFNKITLGLSIGSSIDFLVKHDTKDLPDSKENYSEYSKIAVDINAGIQLGYIINDKFEVYLKPHFADYITPNVKINSTLSNDLFVKINQYNYYGDIIFGLKYRL